MCATCTIKRVLSVSGLELTRMSTVCAVAMRRANIAQRIAPKNCANTTNQSGSAEIARIADILGHVLCIFAKTRSQDIVARFAQKPLANATKVEEMNEP